MDTKRLAEYARLRRIERARKAEADAAKAEADKMMEQLIEDMTHEGVQNMRLVEGGTVYLHTDTRANKNPEVDPEVFHKALRDAGLGDFIRPTVNSNTLASYVRQLEATEEPLPEPLADVLNVHHITTLRVRG